MPYNTKSMLRDVNGDLIPQYYDPVADEFKPMGKDVTLTGSIPEYGWLDTANAPTPSDPTKLAFGVEINTTTHKMTTKYWNGTAWEGVE